MSKGCESNSHMRVGRLTLNAICSFADVTAAADRARVSVKSASQDDLCEQEAFSFSQCTDLLCCAIAVICVAQLFVHSY